MSDTNETTTVDTLDDHRARAEAYMEAAGLVDGLMRLFEKMVESMSDGELGIADVVDVERLRAVARTMVRDVYASVLTLAELDAMLAWSTSEIGRSVAAKQREIEALTRVGWEAIVERCRHHE